ncbi:MAG: hypothetical protein ACPGU7_13135 [Gammaproteobacteria bacterium]
MTNDKPDAPQRESDDTSKDNLVHLETGKANTRPQDINARIGDLEIALSEVDARLNVVDGGFRETSAKAAARDGSINDQLDSVQDELHTLRETYVTLSGRAEAIAKEAATMGRDLGSNQRALAERTKNMETRAEKLASELESRNKVLNSTIEAVESRLIEYLQAAVAESEEHYEQLSARSDEIVASAQALDKEMRQLDQNRGAEIHSLDDRFRGAHDALRQALMDAETTLELHRGRLDGQDERVAGAEARIESLRASEARLAQRCSALETTTDILNTRTNEMQSLIAVMDVRTTTLEERATLSEERIDDHEDRIVALTGTTGRQTRWGIAALLLIGVALGALLAHQHFNTLAEQDNNALIVQGINEQMGAQQVALNETLTTLQSGNDAAHETLTTETRELREQNRKLTETVEQHEARIAALDEKVQTVGDTATSANERLSAAKPLDTFGSDSIVHGPAWLDRQDPNHYVIRLITTNSKAELYRSAQRFGYRMDETFAYYEQVENGTTRYVLVYGTFGKRSDAESTLYRIPTFDPWSRPEVKEISAIQARVS